MMRQWKQTLGVATRRDPLDQPDLLGPEELLPVAAGHSGFPEATDGLAYEPVQRLLAVSTLHTVDIRTALHSHFVADFMCM